MTTKIQQDRRDRAYAGYRRDNLSSLALRQIIRDKYAWPGGYALYGVTSDGAALCCDCMRAEYRLIACARKYNLRDGWRVDAVSNTSECDEFLACDQCGEVLFDPED